MAKKRKGQAKHPRTANRPTIVRRHHEQASPPTDLESQPLMQALKRGLYADHPLDLLLAVAGLVVATESQLSLGARDEPEVSLDELVETFEGTDFAPTTAALRVIATLTPDELLAARIGRVVGGRHQPMPTWLRELRQTEVADVVELSHVLRDGEDYFLDVRLPDGFAMTAVIYVDNNMGQVVKDAFVIPEAFATVRERMDFEGDGDATVSSVDPAATRARLEKAVHIGSITFPPLESDTWPMCRPLVTWLIGLLPAGGAVPDWREWTDEEYAVLRAAFLASPHGAAYDDEDHRGLIDNLLWFGTSHGTGDPLRWSPVNVEILLVDWFPRKIVAETDYLTKLPALLRAFIRYSHAERSIGAHLSAQTMAAVARWEPEYQSLIRTDRPQGAEALARMLLGAADNGVGQGRLETVVGGPDQLASLTSEPLPDEDFDWTDVPEDIRPKIAEILALCDENATEFLDLEHRTANRRLLRQLVVADPAYFGGRAAARTSAAAVCWLIAHANDSVGLYREVTTAELLAPFGVTSASQRGKKFRELLGLGEHTPYDGPMSLESPAFLVSARRAEIIEDRDFVRW